MEKVANIFWVILIVGGIAYYCSSNSTVDEHGHEVNYSVGYKDGYAATWNTACGIRATLIHGAWEIKEYSHGYGDGANKAASDIDSMSLYEKRKKDCDLIHSDN